MAEAIGLVASVVQLAGTGLKLSQALYQYADGVANADRRIREIAKEIRLTSFVIEELGNIFKRDDTLNLISSSAIATANETLRECSELFGEIETTLTKSGKGKMGRLMLPFRENKIELQRNHIDKLKSTLQLMMQVLLHAHRVASDRIDREAETRQREEIRRLLEDKKTSTKKYEESLRNFASDSATEVGDDDSSLDDDRSAPAIETKTIGSTVDPDSLKECMRHVQTLLGSIERLHRALASKSAGDDHSDHQQTAIESYFAARSYLDSVLLGSSNTASSKDTMISREPIRMKTSHFASNNTSGMVREEKEDARVIETSRAKVVEESSRKEIVIELHGTRMSATRFAPEQVSLGPSYSTRPRYAEVESVHFGKSSSIPSQHDWRERQDFGRGPSEPHEFREPLAIAPASPLLPPVYAPSSRPQNREQVVSVTLGLSKGKYSVPIPPRYN